MVVLAMRILSVVPNSAATERVFSKMGIVHNRLRCRLHPEKVRATVLVSEDIARKYPRPIHRKRRFRNVDNDPSVVSSESDDETASTPTTTFRDLADGLIGDAIDSADFEPEPEGTTNANTSPASLPTPRTNSGLALANLFKISRDDGYWGQLWQRGQENLGVEVRFHEISRGSNGSTPGTPSQDLGVSSDQSHPSPSNPIH